MPGLPLTDKERDTRCSQWQHGSAMAKLNLIIEKQMCSLNVTYDNFVKNAADLVIRFLYVT